MCSYKESFCFEYFVPSLDWYETKTVEIKWTEYLFFKIQYRFGNMYFLLGYKEKDGRFDLEEVEIGRLTEFYLEKFVKWCEFIVGDTICSKLIGLSVISTGMNVFSAFGKFFKSVDNYV